MTAIILLGQFGKIRRCVVLLTSWFRRKHGAVLFSLAIVIGAIGGFPAVVRSQEQQSACASIADKQDRIACLQRAGAPVVDCDHPANQDDVMFCREISNNNTGTTNSDPILQWCKEHTNFATCSDLNYCISMCVQKSVTHDPAAVAAQLQREHEARRAQAEHQAQVVEKAKLAQRQGYNPVSFNDFQLDGRDLARNGSRLMLQGFYTKYGEMDILEPSGLAVAAAQQYGPGVGVPLLTENASRDARSFFLQCSQNILAQLGCPVTVIGHADICTMRTLIDSKSVPCLAVDDGWQ